MHKSKSSLRATTIGLNVMTCIIDYVLQNNPKGLKVGLAQGSDPNEVDRDRRTPLILAAIDNLLEVAKLLLESGANVNAQDGLGNSALHYASQEYHCGMAKLLLDNGAIVDVQDKHGNTPLWRAVFYSRGRGDAIEILLKAGADKNHRNNIGKTPLDLAKTIANYNVTRYFD